MRSVAIRVPGENGGGARPSKERQTGDEPLIAAPSVGCRAHAEVRTVEYVPEPAHETVYETEAPPPPAPIVEVQPPPPGAEFVWVAGYHRWDGRRYVWVRGRYERRPHVRARWVPAHWEMRGNVHVWAEGHWG